jgi:hypothetical protein
MASTPMQYVRVDPEKWRKAMARAHSENITLPVMIRAWIEDYIRDDMSISDELNQIMERLNVIRKRLGES